jgi:hypothetical protein
MIYRRKNTVKLAVLFFLLLALLVFLSAVIEIPFLIKTYGEVFPKEKWLITGGNGAQITSNLIDYTRGHTTHYDISQFERGEFISTNFSKYLKDKKEISLGDTVISMQSTNVIDQIIAAEGNLEVALAELKSKNSGEKAPLIVEAENRLKYTQEKAAEQSVLFERTKQLFEKKLNSQQDYELQKWNLDLLNIEAGIYKSQIENLKTGVKPEEVKHLEAQVNSARTYLNFLKQKEVQFTLLSPLHGKIVSSFSSDTLLNVIDYSSVVLHEPVKLSDLIEIKEGDKIQISFTDMDAPLYGYVASIGQEVKFVNSQQIVYITLILDNPDTRFLPGMVIENSLSTRKTTILNYIIHLLRN